MKINEPGKLGSFLSGILSPRAATSRALQTPLPHPGMRGFLLINNLTPIAMRFEPTINTGHLLTLVTLVVGIFGAYGMMDKRVAVVETTQVAQVLTDRRQDEAIADMKRTTREDLKEINSKLDRLLVVAQNRH
jgi:hypothetical protein